LLLAAYLAGRGGDTDTMNQRLAEGEQLARQLHDVPALAFAAFLTGVGALIRNDLPAAIASLEHGLTLAPAMPQPQFAPAVRLQLLNTLGVAVGIAGDRDRSRRYYQEILDITEPRGEAVNQTAARFGLGVTTWHAGEVEQAATQLRQGLRLSRAAGWGARYAPSIIEVLAWTAARQQRHQLAATLLGAADTLWTEHDKPITSTGWMLADHQACEQYTREALGDTAFTDAFHQGQALTGDEILALALDEQRPPVPRPRQAAEAATPLTRREREIADLITQGLSNKEIAGRLVISQRTAESHVEHILTKLGFTTRAQVAAWTAGQRSRDET
jgi:DNA-binding NarL/FixJ family response regulator